MVDIFNPKTAKVQDSFESLEYPIYSDLCPGGPLYYILCSIQDGNLCSFQVALVLEEWFSKTKDDFTPDQDKVNSVHNFTGKKRR